MVIGGTSAVAPLMSGLTLRLNQLSGHAVGDFNTVAYANAGDFTDVTQGNNGAYSAGVGWDPTTGLGSPIGVKLQATLGSRASSGPVASTSSPLLNGDRDFWAAVNSLKGAADTLWQTAEAWARSKTLT